MLDVGYGQSHAGGACLRQRMAVLLYATHAASSFDAACGIIFEALCAPAYGCSQGKYRRARVESQRALRQAALCMLELRESSW